MTHCVFFDLDGTLTDPKEGITRSIQFALDAMGVESPNANDLTWCIGPPLQASFSRLVGERRADDAIVLYRERFSEIGWKENHVYPGIREVLEALGRTGPRLFVATSKPQIFAQRIIKHFNLHGYFEHVFGSELDGERSDKTDLLAHALRETGVAGEATMVGDRKFDLIGAANNRMRAIGVTYGYGSHAELSAAGAHDLAHCPEDLLRLLN